MPSSLSSSSSSSSSSTSKENSLFEEAEEEVMAAEDAENSVGKNKVFPLPPEEPDPPSYDTAVAQEKAERGLIGALLLKTSHVFGMHPFKAPIVCDGDVCQKRRFRDRICIPDLILCIINLFVIFNHLYLYIWACKNSSPGGCEYLNTILYVVESALPLVCVLGMMFCSYHMHNLLQTLTDAHFRVIQKRCMARVNFWRYVLYCINAFFVFGTIMELPQNFMLEIPSASPSNITNMNEKPISQMKSLSHQIFIFIDRYYFPIMNFGVVKVPQLFIMMIALRIAIMFRINANILSKRRMPSRQSLVTYFEQLLDIIKALNMLECCFNKLILAIVTTSVIKIIFTSYATLRELLYHEKFGNLGMMSLFMVKAKDNEAQMDGSFFSFIITIGSTFSVFELLLNILWTVIFIVPCIACNEFSRAALPVITGKLVPDEAKNVKDQIIQKLMDPSWGLTLGKLLKVDRAFAMTLISLIFSIVVVWVQMTVPISNSN